MNKRIIIVGGGNAGFLSALVFNSEDYNVTIISTGATIRVGESTSFVLPLMLRSLNINEKEWMSKCDATFKFTVNFTGWGNDDDRFSHPFTYPGEYGYHYDVEKFTDFLEKKCIERGVTIIRQHVVSVEGDDNGIRSVTTTEGNVVYGDFFVDCTGLKSLLIGNFYKTDFISYHNDINTNDKAVTLQDFDLIHEVNYTNCTAMKCGWMWTIPLKTRTDYGYVYSSSHCTDQDAENELRERTRNSASPARIVTYRSGRYVKSVIKNCIAVGLSNGFIEPLQSTGYGFIGHALSLGIKYIKGELTESALNSSIADMFGCTKNFIKLHYTLCNKNDTKYWRDFKSQRPSNGLLRQIVDLHSHSPNTPHGKIHFEYVIKGMNLVDISQVPPWLK